MNSHYFCIGRGGGGGISYIGCSFFPQKTGASTATATATTTESIPVEWVNRRLSSTATLPQQQLIQPLSAFPQLYQVPIRRKWSLKNTMFVKYSTSKLTNAW
jgi:hypothetical protein